MPPIRTIPTAVQRPVRTERTHEENQERAYIAASRRSDRSLEARVESARRASEIHKKRTGRSLRVREEDVMNEEMYEEEDDDLPMQYRRINALNPGLAYTTLNDRVNSYLAGQLGVRNYLHQAIFQANQNQQLNQQFAQQFYNNPMLQGNNFQSGTMSPQAMNGPSFTQPNWNMSMNGMRPGVHGRSASIATTQELANYGSQTQTAPMQPAGPQLMSTHTAQSPGVLSPAPTSSQPPTPHSLVQTKSSPGPQQVPTPPQSGQTPQAQSVRVPAGTPPVNGSASHEKDANTQLYPLTTKLPNEASQLLDGTPGFANSIYASQLTQGIPMPSMGGYSYNPNGSKKSSNGPNPTGLHQTLSPHNMHNSQSISSFPEPQSAMSAPANLDWDFNSDLYGDFGAFHDPDYNFGLNMGSGSNTGAANNSGQVTPNEGNWNESDFFTYADASD